jgi:flagellar motor switch protein FliN
MSDGSLTQDEIDALLSGVDGGGGGGSLGGGAAPSPVSAPSGSGINDQEKRSFQSLINGVASTQAQTLSMITGQTVSIRQTVVDVANRDMVLQSIGEEVVSVSMDFSEGAVGEHCFIMNQEMGIKLAGLMNHEPGLTQIDDMALSSLQEAVSQFTGPEVTVFSEKSGVQGLLTNPPEGKFSPKAMVQLPAGDFMRVTYTLDLGDGQTEDLVEIFGLPIARQFTGAQGGRPAQQQQQNFGMQGQQQQQQMYAQQMGGMGMMGGGQQQQTGFPGQYGGGQPGVGAPSVQAVQFPSLQMQGANQEQGNIGLLMDVYMEMTVELGRTRKLIREILGMGEGTIIELDKLAGEPVDILVNHKLIAKGEVVVIDENFGVRVTEIVSPMERMSDMS